MSELPSPEQPGTPMDEDASEADSLPGLDDSEDEALLDEAGDDDGENQSEALLQTLHRLEKLMEIAAESLDVIVTMHAPEASTQDESAMDQVDESEDAAVQNFRSIATAYYTLLDKVQFGLRSTVHHMTRQGLLVTLHGGKQVSVPYKANTLQLERDFARTKATIKLLREQRQHHR